MEKNLALLFERYKSAPKCFKATNYWQNYEKKIIDSIENLEIDELRSGKYPAFAHFGFNDIVYSKPKSFKVRILRYLFFKAISKTIGWYNMMPYGSNIMELRNLAYLHCSLYGEITNSLPIQKISMSDFGHPIDLFKIKDNSYSMLFLSYYIRYCFANKNIKFNGDEVIVELGPGSGYQIEILKKLYPQITVLCFDLPAQLYLCEQYLSNVFGDENVVGSQETLEWENLNSIKEGKIHFFGNWKFPLLENFKFDVFWNAASFGEMEPNIVNNYLSYIKGNVDWIYLLQAKKGKETLGSNSVENPITFDNYMTFLQGYEILEFRDAMMAHRALKTSGGYFEAVWSLSDLSE